MVHFCNVTKISLRMFLEGEYFGEMGLECSSQQTHIFKQNKRTICTSPYFSRNFLLEPQSQPSIERCTKIGYRP
jgi:hypothetical protein